MKNDFMNLLPGNRNAQILPPVTLDSDNSSILILSPLLASRKEPLLVGTEPVPCLCISLKLQSFG